MKTFKTYLPVFTGFYNTIFQANNEDCEIDDINMHRRNKNMNEISFDDCNFNYVEYHEEISKCVTEYLHNELKEINIVDSIKFEALYSPREYNFHNDSINVEINLTDDNIKTIKKYLYDNIDLYRQYLKDNYTSCSGFISYFPNHLEGWQELTKDFTEYTDKMHVLGSILEFICEMEEINTDTMYDATTDISVCATNYSELIGE